MARSPRVAPPGLAYHVLNRAVARTKLFRTDRDFEAFQRVLIEAHDRFKLRICSYCVLSTHWHFVTLPDKIGQLSEFFRWLTLTHVMRWRVAHHTVGYGPLYQSRFKSFPIQQDESFLIVCRYVERNALSAGLVRRAQDWRWGSLWARLHGPAELRNALCEWPVDPPRNWVRHVNEPLTPREVDRVKTSIARGRPLGSPQWTEQTVRRLGLEHSVRPEGRPKKLPTKDRN